MADLFGDQASGTRSKSESDKSHEDKPEKKTLLIETHDEFVRQGYLNESGNARQDAAVTPFHRPESLRSDFKLKPHQEQGVRWLQTCTRDSGPSRRAARR